jgi:tripartite-type tricarboxylate transporter receptor subunit TctC
MRTSIAVLSILALGADSAFAQDGDYPSRPIRMIIGFPAGGGVDSVARIMSQRFNEVLKQPVVIDNRGGAGGNIAAEMTAKAPADGYTIHMIPSNFASNPSLYARAGYDPVNEFTAVTLVATTPYVMEVNASVGARSLKEFIALAKAAPGRMNYASGGTGTPSHLGMELFKTMAGINVVHVPYKGGVPALTDLVAGQVAMYLDPIITAMQFVQMGKTRALAVTTSRRTAVLPDVPSAAEAGVPGYEVTGWYGIVVPRMTPPRIVKKLHEATRQVIETPDVRERLKALGLDPMWSTTDNFSGFMRSEIVKWAKVINDSGARVD